MKSRFTGGVCVVGRGRWGSSLLAALAACGIHAWTMKGRAISASGVPKFDMAGRPAQIFWLCVPDAEIGPVARRITKAAVSRRGSLRGTIVVHSSGVMGAEVLRCAQEAGATVGTVHPLMSFPTRKPVALQGVPFAVEAQGALKTKLFRLVRQLGGAPFVITAEGKPLYHAAAVLASPLLVSLATAAQQTAVLSGLSPSKAKELLQPIMEATLRNYFRHGGAKSFSGPFARGDAGTVSLHLKALAVHPSLGRIYRDLALYALDKLPIHDRPVSEPMLRRSLRMGKK